MILCGLTVCVGYAELLRPSVPRWTAGLDRWTVVTAPGDQATLDLCAAAGVDTFQTDAFTLDGAVFNKGRAMSEAYTARTWPDWVVFIDADVIPPAEWRWLVEAATPVPGWLYGARRRLTSGAPYFDGEIAGFFQLFHATDPRVQRQPILDCTWRHAGGYDSEFQFRWPPECRSVIPGLELVHQGEPGQNWWARDPARMARMLRDRQDAPGGIAPDEHL
jgi:hypothetical protein